MDNTQWELDKLRAERDTLSRVAETQAVTLRLFAVAAVVGFRADAGEWGLSLDCLGEPDDQDNGD